MLVKIVGIGQIDKSYSVIKIRSSLKSKRDQHTKKSTQAHDSKTAVNKKTERKMVVTAVKNEERKHYFQRINRETDSWLLNRNIESQRQWNDSFKGQKVNNCQLRIYIQ